uniref:Transmembrane protein 144 n=1 Tax=Heterorhabditis bacteriophora TaxID=37862 RepID=A0A1I7XNW7_HETBA
MFVPIRKYEAGNGIFVQWIMSTAILLTGFIVFAVQDFPGFYPLAMLGGAFWTIGNAVAIPIINRLGMALSILIWNTTNCLSGWAGGRFGLFGMNARPPASDILNYGGLACVIVGSIRVSQVNVAEKEALTEIDSEDSKDEESSKNGTFDRLIGFALALCSGVFYGMTFVPVIYMLDNPEKYPGQPTDGLAYVFSHYFGIFITATAIFLGYIIVKRNNPVINPQIVLPSFGSGLLWAVAQSSFFVANENLSQTVTFPIITMLPGCVASAWSIFYFREIRSRRDLSILGVAMLITICGAMLVGLSKEIYL